VTKFGVNTLGDFVSLVMAKREKASVESVGKFVVDVIQQVLDRHISANTPDGSSTFELTSDNVKACINSHLDKNGKLWQGAVVLELTHESVKMWDQDASEDSTPPSTRVTDSDAKMVKAASRKRNRLAAAAAAESKPVIPIASSVGNTVSGVISTTYNHVGSYDHDWLVNTVNYLDRLQAASANVIATLSSHAGAKLPINSDKLTTIKAIELKVGGMIELVESLQVSIDLVHMQLSDYGVKIDNVNIDDSLTGSDIVSMVTVKNGLTYSKRQEMLKADDKGDESD
jgi:hypothetical protein